MTELSTGFIECYFKASVIKYDFTINRELTEKLMTDYHKAVNSVSALKIDATNNDVREVMIISGDLLRNSTLQMRFHNDC